MSLGDWLHFNVAQLESGDAGAVAAGGARLPSLPLQPAPPLQPLPCDHPDFVLPNSAAVGDVVAGGDDQSASSSEVASTSKGGAKDGPEASTRATRPALVADATENDDDAGSPFSSSAMPMYPLPPYAGVVDEFDDDETNTEYEDWVQHLVRYGLPGLPTKTAALDDMVFYLRRHPKLLVTGLFIYLPASPLLELARFAASLPVRPDDATAHLAAFTAQCTTELQRMQDEEMEQAAAEAGLHSSASKAKAQLKRKSKNKKKNDANKDTDPNLEPFAHNVYFCIDVALAYVQHLLNRIQLRPRMLRGRDSCISLVRAVATSGFLGLRKAEKRYTLISFNKVVRNQRKDAWLSLCATFAVSLNAMYSSGGILDLDVQSVLHQLPPSCFFTSTVATLFPQAAGGGPGAHLLGSSLTLDGTSTSTSSSASSSSEKEPGAGSVALEGWSTLEALAEAQELIHAAQQTVLWRHPEERMGIWQEIATLFETKKVPARQCKAFFLTPLSQVLPPSNATYSPGASYGGNGVATSTASSTSAAAAAIATTSSSSSSAVAANVAESELPVYHVTGAAAAAGVSNFRLSLDEHLQILSFISQYNERMGLGNEYGWKSAEQRAIEASLNDFELRLNGIIKDEAMKDILYQPVDLSDVDTTVFRQAY